MTILSAGDDNLAEDRLTKTALAGATSWAIETDLGSAKPVNTIALMSTNFTDGATFQVRGASSQAALTSSPDYDSTSIAKGIFEPTGGDNTVLRRPFLHFPPSDPIESLRYWRVDVTDAGNPGGDLEAGRLLLCRSFQPTHDIAANFDVEFVDPSVAQKVRGGDLLYERREKIRKVRLSLPFASKDEAEQEVRPLLRLVGVSAPILAVLDPDESDFRDDGVVYGRLTSVRPLRMVSPSFFSLDMEILEFPSGQILGKV